MYTIVVTFPTIASIILPLILVFSISFYRKFTYSWWKTARAWDIKAREIIMRWSFVVNEFEQGNKKKKRNKKKKKEDFHYEPTVSKYHLLFHLLYSFCTTFFHSVKWFMRTSYFTPLKSRFILQKWSKAQWRNIRRYSLLPWSRLYAEYEVFNSCEYVFKINNKLCDVLNAKFGKKNIMLWYLEREIRSLRSRATFKYRKLKNKLIFFVLTITNESRFMVITWMLVISIGYDARIMIINKSRLVELSRSGQSSSKIMLEISRLWRMKKNTRQQIEYLDLIRYYRGENIP